MVLRLLALILVGGTAGLAAFAVFQKTALPIAVISFATVAWILWRFTGVDLFVDTGKYLIRPETMFFLALGVGITYLALDLEIAADSVLGGLGIGFLGAAVGMLLFKYWNIGG